MNREEANQALELIRRVVAQARDDTALQNWGVIWMLHSFVNGAAFAATNWLWTEGHRTPGPYALLWAGVLAFNITSIFVLKRGQSAGARSFIERQIWAIWTTFIVGMVLVALINWLLGLDRLFMPSVACVLFGTAFSMMGALMGRVWYAVAVGFALAALGMTQVPDHAFNLLGAAWFAAQFGGGFALHRARPQAGRRGRRGAAGMSPESLAALVALDEFGEAQMVMAREGELLTAAVDPEPAFPGGRLVGVFDTRPLPHPPPGSVWTGLEDLHEPLVECYDALGVAEGCVYVLTIDREPWNARFVTPVQLYSEYFDDGPLAPGARLDSVLHLTECAYRWRPLRRERHAR